MISDLLQRLAEQQAAITAAQAALRRLVELGLDGALGAPEAPQSAICAAPGCSTPLPVQTTGGQRRRYRSDLCRGQAATRRIRARRAEQEAAATRAQTVAVMDQAAQAGFPSTLKWNNGNATGTEERPI
jgi:hypothetical protein